LAALLAERLGLSDSTSFGNLRLCRLRRSLNKFNGRSGKLKAFRKASGKAALLAAYAIQTSGVK